MLEKRSGGLRGLNDFGGLRKVAPVFSGLMGIALFSSLGLPGLNGFVGEFLIFKGAFPLAPWAASLSVLGLLVTAIFMLTVIQTVFSGPLNESWAAIPDLTIGERLALVPARLDVYSWALSATILGLINSTAYAAGAGAGEVLDARLDDLHLVPRALALLLLRKATARRRASDRVAGGHAGLAVAIAAVRPASHRRNPHRRSRALDSVSSASNIISPPTASASSWCC